MIGGRGGGLSGIFSNYVSQIMTVDDQGEVFFCYLLSPDDVIFDDRLNKCLMLMKIISPNDLQGYTFRHYPGKAMHVQTSVP